MNKIKRLFQHEGFQKWLKRVGIGGFLFFLLKGIAWLIAGYFILDWV